MQFSLLSEGGYLESVEVGGGGRGRLKGGDGPYGVNRTEGQHRRPVDLQGTVEGVCVCVILSGYLFIKSSRGI